MAARNQTGKAGAFQAANGKITEKLVQPPGQCRRIIQ